MMIALNYKFINQRLFDPLKNHYYLLEFQFLGFRYHGFQKQPEVKTVQGMLEKTINYVLGHDNFKTLGAGRTDAMVSANCAAFELFLKEPINTQKFLSELNENLPPDINILNIQEVDKDFNIIQSSKEKEYLYLFSMGEKFHPFSAPYMTFIKGELDIELMKQGATLFEGKHDFRQYCYKPSDNTQFERVVNSSQIVENNIYSASFFPHQSFLYKVKGSGFMRHQIRIMMGTLFSLGKERLTLDDISESLVGKSDNMMAAMAPPSGLILNSITFD